MAKWLKSIVSNVLTVTKATYITIGFVLNVLKNLGYVLMIIHQ